MVVVFPAPSGPTSAKISPSSISRVRLSTATRGPPPAPRDLPSNTRVRFSAWMIMLTRQPPSQRDLRIHRHVVLQLMTAVFDVHLDAVDQLHTLLFGLDLLGCELSFRRNEGDHSVIDLARVGIRRELHF